MSGFEISGLMIVINEPHYEKTLIFAYAKSKEQISCAVTAQLISAVVFTTWIVQSLFFLNPKFQASSRFLRLFVSDLVGNHEDCRGSNVCI